jgi:hypothetical protein
MKSTFVKHRFSPSVRICTYMDSVTIYFMFILLSIIFYIFISLDNIVSGSWKNVGITTIQKVFRFSFLFIFAWRSGGSHP